MEFDFGLNLSEQNILPLEGSAFYFGPIFTTQEAKLLFDELLSSVTWENDRAVILGKLITTQRKVAWYADSEMEYTYSKVTKRAIYWPKNLHALKSIVESKTKETFNACLLNLYHSGNEGMSWHSDNEKDLKKHGTIASLSLGAERKFCFKHKKSKQVVSLILASGSLLTMKGETQEHWLHCLPPSKRVTSPRINLTFRTINPCK